MIGTLTAIELGTDICAIARTAVRRGQVKLFAADTLDPASFPGVEAFVAALRQARRRRHFPRRCHAIVWGLPDGARRNDPAVTPMLAPLVSAGFRVDRVVTPCNALAALGRVRTPRGDGGTCWLAINRGGVAIVVLRPGRLLYAHSFIWDSSVGATGSQARLLQRYSLVSFLAPEVRRAMAAAREQGAPVEAIVTCGNLPDLRSLTMPLIEELDVEVETLDSLEGLDVKPNATDRLSEIAPAIRLACAGAIARHTRPFDPSKKQAIARRRMLVAAVAVLSGVLVVAYAWYLRANQAPRTTPVGHGVQAKPIAKPQAETASRNQPAKTPTAIPPTRQEPPPTTAPTASGETVKPKPRVASAPRITGESKPPVVSTPAPKPAPATRPPLKAPPHPVQSATPAPAAALHAPPVRADKPDAAIVRRPKAEPLRDPVPRVTAILVSSDRRLATIDDGHIISIGDVLGRRVVTAIDEHAVVLREPSGVQIRVGLGGRVLGIDR
ncbi:MAG TPA: hypothetical protein VL225_03655 [Vicinamibacterales bacterium]|jgi:hypothetical protein|nr:hypothetical protein [Vicinamibacterales bacterium]